MASHNDFGAAAEQRAAELLQRGGWQVLHRNWRFRQKELDLVVRRRDVVAFVEVRARRPGRHGHPLETIGPRKRRELEAAARAWIARHGTCRDVYRFDVITFVTAPGRVPVAADASHLEDAWRVPAGSGTV
jgi:putative endonuclease